MNKAGRWVLCLSGLPDGLLCLRHPDNKLSGPPNE